jgi:hypothetical protein
MTPAVVHAELVGVTPSLESVDYARALLRFRNTAATPARVRRYRVAWDGGSITADPTDLVIPPGGTREWRLRIDYSHGDVDRLTASARVEVLEVEL